MNRQDVIDRCLNEDVLGIDSKVRIYEVASKILRRLALLDDYLLMKFIKADAVTSKFVLLYSIMRQDKLFFEFIFEIYQDAIYNSKQYISQDDFDRFFLVKKESSDIVRGWSEVTINDLAKAYRNILKDSGFGRKEKRKIVIHTPLVDPEVLTHIEKLGYSDFVISLFGGA